MIHTIVRDSTAALFLPQSIQNSIPKEQIEKSMLQMCCRSELEGLTHNFHNRYNAVADPRSRDAGFGLNVGAVQELDWPSAYSCMRATTRGLSWSPLERLVATVSKVQFKLGAHEMRRCGRS